MLIKNKYVFLPAMLLLLLSEIAGCKKFLDEKPKQSDQVVTNLSQLQAMLDAGGIVNAKGSGGYAEMLSDNVYVSDATWNTVTSTGNPTWIADAQTYIWGNLSSDNSWSLPYSGPIYFSNIALDQLPLLHTGAGDQDLYNVIKGSALFYRSLSFLGLAQLFCKPYSADNAGSPGIILRTTSDVSTLMGRATVQETYDRIINDLKTAADLLPTTVLIRTRPSKGAAYAALARTYLFMRDYTNAGHYADLALQQHSTLMDYNDLVPVGSPPIKTLNPEVIFHDHGAPGVLIIASFNKMDTVLYNSYDNNDLRKTVFFKPNTGANAGTWSFRGSYNGNNSVISPFDGLATDEQYLIRAECAARAGNKDAALTDLNTLLVTRWNKNVAWTPITATDANDALAKVLAERRKELIFRGLRWPDIRRLNLEGANITLKRVILGNTYTLPPNDIRSVMVIPFREINNNPQVTQNPR